MCWLSAASLKANEIREQGFSGAAMLPYSELEYGGMVKKMEKLEPKLKLPVGPSRRDLRHNSGGQVRCAPTSCRVSERCSSSRFASHKLR
jgi:hypothetical protein